MAKVLTISRFWGPLATITFTVIYHVTTSYFGFFISVGWLWVFMIIGAFMSGRRAALIAATWTSLYAYYLMPTDLSLTIQRVVISFTMAWVAGWQTHNLRQSLARMTDYAARVQVAMERAEKNEAAAKALDALNGNILRIQRARETLLTLLKNQPLDEPTRDEIRVVLHTLNNLELATAGWKALDKLKADIDTRREENDA